MGGEKAIVRSAVFVDAARQRGAAARARRDGERAVEGHRRHDRAGDGGADPVHRPRQRDSRSRPAGARSTSTSTSRTTRPAARCSGSTRSSSVDDATIGVAAQHLFTGSGARHQVERSEQALGVLRHLLLLTLRTDRPEGRTGRKARSASSPAHRLSCPSGLSALRGSHRQSRADHRRQAHRPRRRRRDLAQRGVDVALSYARSQAEADRAVDAVRAAKRRAAAFHADLSQPEACGALVQSAVDDLRPPRHPDQHGVGLRAAAVRRPDAPPTGTRS